MNNTTNQRQARLRLRISRALKHSLNRPRLSIFRSLNHVYAQIIDDTTGKTLVSYSSIKESGSRVAQAVKVGKEIAKIAKEKKITAVVFDRNSYPYKGAVKALCEAAREEGLTI